MSMSYNALLAFCTCLSYSWEYKKILSAVLAIASLILLVVVGSRGAQGGYSLSRSPELISVGDVLKALEGTTALVDCVGTEGTECTKVCSCSTRPLWLKLQRRIDDVLDSTTIRDMADDYKIQTERITELQ